MRTLLVACNMKPPLVIFIIPSHKLDFDWSNHEQKLELLQLNLPTSDHSHWVYVHHKIIESYPVLIHHIKNWTGSDNSMQEKLTQLGIFTIETAPTVTKMGRKSLYFKNRVVSWGTWTEIKISLTLGGIWSSRNLDLEIGDLVAGAGSTHVRVAIIKY